MNQDKHWVTRSVDTCADYLMAWRKGLLLLFVLVTLGLSALIIPLRVSRQLVRLDIPMMILAGLLVFTLAANEELTPVDGLLLLIALLCRCHPGRNFTHT